MHVLSIGTDRSVFQKGSAARTRQQAYAEALGALDLIVFTTEPHERVVDGSLTIIPTNSTTRWQYVSDAIGHAKYLERPDVVTVQDPFETGFAGVRVAKRVKAPLHVQVHTDFAAPGFAARSLLNRLRVFLARRTLRHAARVRAVSDRVKHELLSRYGLMPDRVSVLPIYVDTNRYAAASVPPTLEQRFAQFSTMLLIVSRLEPEKNLDLAIRSFLQAAQPGSCLVIVGSGSEERRLRDAYRMEPNIYFEGEQDPAPYYKLADLLLVTSIYEGYGRTIIEALAAGTPVLSTDVGIAQESGAIVVPESVYPEALSEWLKEGRRDAALQNYPYADFAAYVRLYSADIAACIKKH